MDHKPYRRRIDVTCISCLLVLGALIGKLFSLQIVRHDYYVKKARQNQFFRVPILPKRGNIYDRNRRALAVSVLRDSLYANTNKLPRYRGDIARRLARVLGRSPRKVYNRLTRSGYVPVARLLDPPVAARVRNLLEEGLAPKGAFYFVRESKRLHPKGKLACHVLGFAVMDHTGENKGVEGLEYKYDKEIRGNYQKYKALRDAHRRLLKPVDEQYYSAAFGNDLVLTLDESVQHVAERELRKAVERFRARCGVVIVQKCKTGEILAMASWPDYDPDAHTSAPTSSLRNRAVSDAFNMGSIMKIFTAAALVETGRLASLDELIDCHNGYYRFPGRPEPIRDAPGHYLGIVPFREVFRWSSNVGMVEAAQRMNRYEYSRILEGFGFGRKTGIDLPGEGSGILRPVTQWTAYTMLALPFGGEMAVTPIQLVTAVSAVANGGLLMRPYVVKEVRTYNGRLVRRTQPTAVRRVVSRLTSRRILELMEEVVGRQTADGQWVGGGTGQAARIEGYRVAGKTGTYKYVTTRRGDRLSSYTASFVAVLPLPDPELTIFCLIDDPHGEKYGGKVAAPVVRKIAQHAVRILGIAPNRSDRSPVDVELALQRVRERGRSDIRPVKARRRMPDLRGLTMREVYAALAGLDLRVSFEGTGVVIDQQPPAGSELRRVRECRVVFGHGPN